MAFGTSVEDWRPLVSAQAGNLNTSAGDQTEFLLAWTSKESNGYPCDTTSLGEVGIAQLEPPDNLVQAGTTVDAQHPVPPCTAGKTTYPRYADLTSDQANAQVSALVAFTNYCIDTVRTDLAAVGATWDETQADFWKLVKGVHVSPVMVRSGLAKAASDLGRPPATWDEFFASNTGHYPANWLSNAASVGAYGGGNPSPSIVDYYNVNIDTNGAIPPMSGKEIVLAGIFAIGAFFAAQRASRYLFGKVAV
jgi:hypothetical protein